MQKFFLYVRKSTDVEDKQVLSLEAQLTELRAFAEKENLYITETFIEKQTAKIPGRPIFNAMLGRIENGEAQGIISWHPDRLARNSIDGGKIIYLLDIRELATLKFPQFWYENTAQGKFMLNMAFGQSKYYVDSLSENTKRGLRQKVRNGIYPSLAPIGYLNDVRKKIIVIDKKHGPLIRQAFERYAEGNSCLEDISVLLAQHGIFSRNGRPLKRDRITFTLSNPFYYGHFRYSKEVYEGKHEAIITKQLFDRVQGVLKQRRRPQYKLTNDPEVFCGLMSCATCGMMVTGEYRTKKQKNGNEHHYIYYHCTKKNKAKPCGEPCIREEEVNKQISNLIEQFSMPESWSDQLLSTLEAEEKDSRHSSTLFLTNTKQAEEKISTKLHKLLDSYLNEDIERDVYLAKKAEFMSEKKSVEENILAHKQNHNSWIEPMREWVKEAVVAAKIARDNDLFQKKVIAKKLFGSNLQLSGRTIQIQRTESRGYEDKNAYAALCAAVQDTEEISERVKLVAPRGVEPLFSG